MTPTKVVVAGAVAAILLAAAEIVWLVVTVPAALVPHGGPIFVLSALLPRAALVGAAAGLIGSGVLDVVRRASDLGARWCGAPEQWIAALAALAVSAAALLMTSALLRGRQAHLGGLRPLIIVVLAGGAAWCAWELVRGGYRLGEWMGEPEGESRRRRLVRILAPLLATLAAGAFYVADRRILVRLYEPLHVGLRVGTFLVVVAGWLAFWQLGKRPAVQLGRWRSIVLAASAVAALLVTVRLDGKRPDRAAALTVVTLHGAIGETFVRLTDLVTRPAAPSPKPGRTTISGNAGMDQAFVAPMARGANVLLITIDALRADHLGLYGYPRATSPNLDALAGKSAVFERAYTSAPHTSFALASLLTAQPAMSFSELGLLDQTPTAADLVGANGYHTAAFFSPAVFFVDQQLFRSFENRSFGFQSVHPDRFDESSSAPSQTDQVLSFLSTRSPERFFAWVHYFAPHEPYVEHPESGKPFGKTALDRYDDEIRWTDQSIGRLVASVRAAYPRTIIVVTADHGEEFGEHGGAYHGTTLYDEQIRVPLLISVPGAPPRRVAAAVSTTSVLPTLLALTGIPATIPFEGTSLVPWLGAETVPSEDRLPVVFAENSGQVAAIHGHDKLLCHFKPERCVLFDLVADRSELVDTSHLRPQRFSALKDEMDAWTARYRDHRRQDAWSALADQGTTPAARRAAARLLARSPDRRRLPDLQAAWTSESDPTVRAWLAAGLSELGHVPGRADLASAIGVAGAADEDGELTARIALARSSVVGESAVPDLIAALSRTLDVNFRCALMHALSQWRTPQAGTALIQEYEAIRSRVCCAEAFARLGDPTTVPFILSRLIDEPYVTVQQALVRALARIRDPVAIPKLHQLRSETSELSLAEVVDSALLEMAEEPSGT